MIITLNGTPTDVSVGTVAELLDGSGEPPARGVAVAVNGAVVPRSQLDSRVLAPGDVVEVVTAVQGG